MAFELKEGQGTLFRNAKDGNDARPDYRGECHVGGTMYRISGWIKEGKRGKWMSLKIEVPRAVLEERQLRDPLGKPVDVDEDIPF